MRKCYFQYDASRPRHPSAIRAGTALARGSIHTVRSPFHNDRSSLAQVVTAPTTPLCQVVTSERSPVDKPGATVDNFRGLWTTGPVGGGIVWRMGIIAGGQRWEPSWIGTGGPALAQNNRGVLAWLSTMGKGESSCVGITISGVIPTFHTTTVKTVFSLF